MTFGNNGEFRVTLSANKPDFGKDSKPFEQNWLELPARARGIVMGRNTFTDWQNEVAGTVTIQREGTDGHPSMIQTPRSTAERIRAATRILSFQGKFWGVSFQDRTFNQENGENNFTTWASTEFGLPTQYNARAHFVLEQNKAIIITANVTDAQYHGIQITDVWGVSPTDWPNRQQVYPGGRMNPRLTSPPMDCIASC